MFAERLRDQIVSFKPPQPKQEAVDSRLSPAICVQQETLGKQETPGKQEVRTPSGVSGGVERMAQTDAELTQSATQTTPTVSTISYIIYILLVLYHI